MISTRHLFAALLIAIGLAGGGLIVGNAFKNPGGDIRQATVLPEPRTLADFELVGQDEDRFRRDDLLGKWHLLFFGFTHCPDICPATLQQLSVARRRLADKGGELPDIVLISVDPRRDTPQVLREYVAHFGDGVHGVTGDEARLQAFTSTLGIHYEAVPPATADSDYAVNHSTAVLLTNPQAKLRAVFSTPHSIDAFVNDLPLIMAMQ